MSSLAYCRTLGVWSGETGPIFPHPGMRKFHRTISKVYCEEELDCGSHKSSFVHFSAGKSGLMAEVIVVAISEAVVKILLLCLCLIFLRSVLFPGGVRRAEGQW